MTHRHNLIKDLLQNSTPSTRLLFIATTVSLVFGMWGWHAVSVEGNLLYVLNLGDIIYRSIAALTLSVHYQTGISWEYQWQLEVARWSGIVAVVTGASKASFALLNTHWLRRKATNREGHWLIVGSDPFAAQICQSASVHKTVHWLAAGDGHTPNKKLVIDKSHWSLSNAEALGLKNAAGVMIATNDDATTGAIAREIRASYADEKQLAVLASIRSPWLAMRIDEIEGVPGIAVFSEAQIALRHLHRRQPPFLIADTFNHRRIHTVIVDFSDYGEAALIETLLSSLTTNLTKPLFTIVDPKADSIQQDLVNRYPELAKSADLVFMKGSLTEHDTLLGSEDIYAVSERAPVTTFYSCHNDDEIALVTAIALQSISRKHVEAVAPIFTRQSRKQGLPLISSGVSKIKSGDLIGFGSLKDLSSEVSFFSKNADSFAQEFHSAYEQVSSDEKSAKVPWEELSEDMRDANRRLVVHIPAKLHCIGFDLEAWLRNVDRHPGRVQIPTISSIRNRDVLIESLAILEHERWMADRRINGWTHGLKRDDLRRIHPDLVPFSQLSEESKRYDRTMVKSLLKMTDGGNTQ